MVSKYSLSAAAILPEDAAQAVLVGRVWSKAVDGPCPVLLRDGRLLDLTSIAATVSFLFEQDGLVGRLISAAGLADLGSLDDFLSGKLGDLLAPIDLQSIKAAGVTFADSMLERVIEEQTREIPPGLSKSANGWRRCSATACVVS